MLGKLSYNPFLFYVTYITNSCSQFPLERIEKTQSDKVVKKCYVESVSTPLSDFILFNLRCEFGANSVRHLTSAGHITGAKLS